MRVLKHRKMDRPRAVNRKRHADNAERQHVHVTKGDDVRVVRGEHKGSSGKVMRVYLKTGRVVVQGVNLVKKHRRARNPEELALQRVTPSVDGQRQRPRSPRGARPPRPGSRC